MIFHFDLFIQNPFFLRYNILYYFNFKLFSTRDNQLALVMKGFLILFVQGILLCRRNMPSFFQALYFHWEHFLSLRILTERKDSSSYHRYVHLTDISLKYPNLAHHTQKHRHVVTTSTFDLLTSKIAGSW